MGVMGAILDTGAIVAAREAGATYAELTARFGSGPGQLKTILSKYNLHGSPKIRCRVPADVQARMCELRDAGRSRREVARETGWSIGAVVRAMERRERGRA